MNRVFLKWPADCALRFCILHRFLISNTIQDGLNRFSIDIFGSTQCFRFSMAQHKLNWTSGWHSIWLRKTDVAFNPFTSLNKEASHKLAYFKSHLKSPNAWMNKFIILRAKSIGSSNSGCEGELLLNVLEWSRVQNWNLSRACLSVQNEKKLCMSDRWTKHAIYNCKAAAAPSDTHAHEAIKLL